MTDHLRTKYAPIFVIKRLKMTNLFFSMTNSVGHFGLKTGLLSLKLPRKPAEIFLTT